MKKTKEEHTLARTPKKKKSANKGRLSSMLESMQKRSNPVNAHKVATKYFDDFRKERSISFSKEPSKDSTAVDTGVITAESSVLSTAVDNAVSTAIGKKPRKPSSAKVQNKITQSEVLDDSHSQSESKVYWSMREGCNSKKSPQLRFGLKDLKEKTELSDKTIRNAIHSLEEKLSIKVVEPSLGVYGRKIKVFGPEEILEKRKKAGLVIDSTTKKIISSTTAVINTVDSAVSTAVGNAQNHKNSVVTLYKKYTGNDWDEKAEKFYKTIEYLKPEIVESAFILGILKEKKNDKHISDFKSYFKDLNNELPKTYLDHLRGIWKEFSAK